MWLPLLAWGIFCTVPRLKRKGRERETETETEREREREVRVYSRTIGFSKYPNDGV